MNRMAKSKTRKKPKRRRVCNNCGKFFYPEDARKLEQECPFCGEFTKRAQTKSQLTARADWCFSRLVRFLRADKRGMVKCCTCGAEKKWEEVDAGHYMSRTFRETRWDIRNCWPQCKMCNSGYGARKWSPDESVKNRYTDFLRHTLTYDMPDILHRKALSGGEWPIARLRELVRYLDAGCDRHGLL